MTKQKCMYICLIIWEQNGWIHWWQLIRFIFRRHETNWNVRVGWCMRAPQPHGPDQLINSLLIVNMIYGSFFLCMCVRVCLNGILSCAHVEGKSIFGFDKLSPIVNLGSTRPRPWPFNWFWIMLLITCWMGRLKKIITLWTTHTIVRTKVLLVSVFPSMTSSVELIDWK
jgi:hypothetical protein